jgi:hypothetical protein
LKCVGAVGTKANVLQSFSFVRWVAALLILPKRWLVILYESTNHNINFLLAVRGFFVDNFDKIRVKNKIVNCIYFHFTGVILISVLVFKTVNVYYNFHFVKFRILVYGIALFFIYVLF